jgi:hypothetical protein
MVSGRGNGAQGTVPAAAGQRRLLFSRRGRPPGVAAPLRPRREVAGEQGPPVRGWPAGGHEIIAVMRPAGHDRRGHRPNVVVVLWRAGLRINEALALSKTDLDHRRGSILARAGKNNRRREAGMDAWAWSALEP